MANPTKEDFDRIEELVINAFKSRIPKKDMARGTLNMGKPIYPNGDEMPEPVFFGMDFGDGESLSISGTIIEELPESLLELEKCLAHEDGPNLKIAVEPEYGTDHMPNTMNSEEPLIIKPIYERFIKRTLNHEQMKSLKMQDAIKGGVSDDTQNTEDRYILDGNNKAIINPNYNPHHIKTKAMHGGGRRFAVKPIIDIKSLSERMQEIAESFNRDREKRIESILTSTWENLQIPNKDLIQHISPRYALEFICAKEGVPMRGKATPEFDKSNYEFVVKKPLGENFTLVSWKRK